MDGMDNDTLLKKPKVETSPRWLRLSDDDYRILHNYAVKRGSNFAQHMEMLAKREIARIKEMQKQDDTVQVS